MIVLIASQIIMHPFSIIGKFAIIFVSAFVSTLGIFEIFRKFSISRIILGMKN
ncbi:MAG: hypothetical protein NT027_14040 [Proteobacteria bacterium]|nr:hypothetical protein [Pseudomonadota bacterium]